jgi:hypothetical protein
MKTKYLCVHTGHPHVLGQNNAQMYISDNLMTNGYNTTVKLFPQK